MPVGGEEVGRLVPVILFPRYSSLVGPGDEGPPDHSYKTAPVNVEPYANAKLTFWRGAMVGGAAMNPFKAYFEESHDALTWTEATVSPSQPVTTVNAVGDYVVSFAKRWFRIRIHTAANGSGVVSVSVWMAGVFETRVPQSPG